MKKIVLTGEFESSKVRLRGNRKEKSVSKNALLKFIKKIKNKK
jgi:hypothetical protein